MSHKIYISNVDENGVVKNPKRNLENKQDTTPFHQKIYDKKQHQTAANELPEAHNEPFIIMEDVEFYIFVQGAFYSSGDKLYTEFLVKELLLKHNKHIDDIKVLKQVKIKTGVFIDE